LISKSRIKGADLGRILTVVFVLALLTPTTSPAQGRIFQRGESGVTGAIDYFRYRTIHGMYWDSDATSWVAVTFKGLFDLGIGREADRDNFVGPYLLGNLPILDHDGKRGIGLELGGRYARHTEQHDHYHEVFVGQVRYHFVESRLHLFRRLVVKPRNRLVLGLKALHRFNRYEEKAPDGTVLVGRQYNEWGGAVDLQSVVWGLAYLGLDLEYAQHKAFGDRWRFTYTITVGLTLYFSGAEG